MLQNVDGLGGLTSVAGDLRIIDNDALLRFCGLYPLLDADGLGGTYSVFGNLNNPSELEILMGEPCPEPSAVLLHMAALLSLAGLRRRLN